MVVEAGVQGVREVGAGPAEAEVGRLPPAAVAARHLPKVGEPLHQKGEEAARPAAEAAKVRAVAPDHLAKVEHLGWGDRGGKD